jgi:hypothetical protein
VYDNCFDESITRGMRDALVKVDENSGFIEETRVIDRFEVSLNELSSIERALLSFVDELGNDEEPSRFVEWWWRDEW